ncbi:MAG: hypothetical protein J6B85_08640 [Lachnospiraceae bacterium]|nr:hypothetical protein [Lachnospiraceae bacterium]
MSNNWQDDPRLKNLDPRKLLILNELASEASGVSLDKALPILLKANARLKALGLTFTKQESELMFDILTKDLSPQEKLKLDALRKSPLFSGHPNAKKP